MIGKGAFGVVTLVRKNDTQELFAMKTLNKQTIAARNQRFHTKSKTGATSSRAKGVGKCALSLYCAAVLCLPNK